MLHPFAAAALSCLLLSNAAVVSSAAVVGDADRIDSAAIEGNGGGRASFLNVEYAERHLRNTEKQRKKEERRRKHQMQNFASERPIEEGGEVRMQTFASGHAVEKDARAHPAGLAVDPPGRAHPAGTGIDPSDAEDVVVDGVSETNHGMETRHKVKKKKRTRAGGARARGKTGKATHRNTHVPTTMHSETPSPYTPSPYTPAPHAPAPGHASRTSKSRKGHGKGAKGGKASIVPTPYPSTQFPTMFDWCPEVSSMERESRSDKGKPWADGKRFERDGRHQVHKKNFKFPSIASNGGDDGGPLVDHIVGGTDVDPTLKYKFFVSLGGCGGSLVAPNIVLSAAHCEGVAETVTLGLQRNIFEADEIDEFSDVEHIPIKRSVIHPCYFDVTTEYDIWVIELEWSTQKYADHVVDLDAPGDDLDLDDGAEHELVVMGFGGLFGGGPVFPTTNQEVAVDYIPNHSCNEMYNDLITASMLCAGSLGKDSCQGDSGGPLIHPVTQKQVGIVSWGYGCADPSFAGVYARVSMGYDWIVHYITEWEADVPAPSPGVCVDEPEGWFDSGSPIFNCFWYASEKDLCTRFGDSFANGGLTANEACCACTPIDYPDEMDEAREAGVASFNVTFGYNGTYEANAHGLEPATITPGNVTYDGEQLHEFEIAGAAFFRVAMPPDAVANDFIDLDLYLIDPAGEIVESSFNDGTDESVEVISPMDGNWSVAVYGWNTEGPSAAYDMYSWILPATPGGSLELLAAPDSATFNETETVDFRWTGATEEEWHLGAISHTAKGLLNGLTLVNVDNRNRVPGYPDSVKGTGENGTATFRVTFDYAGPYAAGTHGLVPPTIHSGSVTPRWYGWELREFELSKAAYLRMAIPPRAVADPANIDLDLYLLDPTNQLVAKSTKEGTNEMVEVFLPMDGMWSIYVYAYAQPTAGGEIAGGGVASGPSAVDYDMYSWIISATPGGNMFVIASPDEAIMGETGTIDIGWADATAGELHLGAVSHSNETSIMALTLVSVDNRDLV